MLVVDEMAVGKMAVGKTTVEENDIFPTKSPTTIRTQFLLLLVFIF